jgi:hypothetical protein
MLVQDESGGGSININKKQSRRGKRPRRTNENSKTERSLVRKTHQLENIFGYKSLGSEMESTSFLKDGRDIFDITAKFDLPFEISVVGVHNLTGKIINEAILKFLSLGLNFAFKARMADDESTMTELQQFFRSTRIRYQFGWNDAIPALYVPNKSYQPPKASRAIENFLGTIQQRMTTALQANPYRKIRFQRAFSLCIRSISSNSSIYIGKADKNCGVVILNRLEFEAEAMMYLQDKKTYRELEQAPSYDTLWNGLIDVLNRHNVALDCPMAKFILQKRSHPEEIRYAVLYFLVKVHKDRNSRGMYPLRPICSQIGTVSYYASKYIHLTLMPLVKEFIPTYFDDPILLLQYFQASRFPATSILYGADVVNLYPSIPIEDGLTVCKCFLTYDVAMPTKDINLIIDLLNFVLNNNYFEFAGKSFLQIKGTAMGKNCAVVFANIYLHSLEQQALSNCALYGDRSFISPRVLVRYIDDYFGLFDRHRDAILFSKILQGLRRGLKLSDIQLGNTVHFLDMHFTQVDLPDIADIKVDVELFTKPTAAFQYIHFKSDHPISMKRAFISAELYRIFLRSSERRTYIIARDNFYYRLLTRSYPAKEFLDPIFNEHFSNEFSGYIISREDALYRARRLSYISTRLQHKNSKLQRTSLIYLTKRSKERINLREVFEFTKCSECSPDIVSLFGRRLPTFAIYGYNTLSRYITSSKYKHSL